MPLSSKNTRLTPIMKYPGGKEKELIHITLHLPPAAQNYYEPFVGGGAVYFAIDAEHYFINDKSEELMNLYNMIATSDNEFFTKLEQIQHNWDVMSKVIDKHSDDLITLHNEFKNNVINKLELSDKVSSFVYRNSEDFNGMLTPEFNVEIENFVNELIKSFKNKIMRMVYLEKKKGDLCDSDILLNIEGAFKSAFYTHFRHIYNNVEDKDLKISLPFSTAIYFFIREYCYSSMFRYNSSGKFNVPYGGISYNKKSMAKKIAYFKQNDLLLHFNRTTMEKNDFDLFLKNHVPEANDFIFLDPPYDTEFSTYAKNEFGQEDQKRLAKYLIEDCDAYFMLVIKNTEFISGLYPDGTKVKGNRYLKVRRFEINYQVSFQDRNNKLVEHLYITNY